MSLPKMKFAHSFYKLRGQKQAALLDVVIANRSSLDDDMVALDVQYYVDVPLEHDPDSTKKECRQYELPSGYVVILTLKGDKGIPFTTIRKYRDRRIEKLKEQAKEKQIFEIVVEEDK